MTILLRVTVTNYASILGAKKETVEENDTKQRKMDKRTDGQTSQLFYDTQKQQY